MNIEELKYKVFALERKIGRFFYRKHIWLVSDRPTSAGDNGEAFFKYLQTRDVNSVFAISSKSSDYERIAKIGKTVEYESIWYRFLLCVADAHISSQLIHMENHRETPQIFLQHGVVIHDIHKMLEPVSHDNFYILCVGKKEKNLLEGAQYRIQKDHIWMTGAPRFDERYNAPKKKVIIAFTWRRTLSEAPRERFCQSDYYKTYQRILSDYKLIEKAKNYGYRICIKMHPEMEKYSGLMELPKEIELFTGSYNEMYAEANLLITDYSSAIFDFLYLEKPVIYYQFDRDSFYKQQLYSIGKYDYRRDGFGEIATEYVEFRDLVIDYMKNQCKMKAKYIERERDFFQYHDKHNCERVYKKISEAITKNKNKNA